MKTSPYDREAAVEYAKRWTLSRNPEYMDFDGLGGDCTNFVSQCLFSGCRVMNYTKDTGWYYNSPDDRAAAWTSAQYLNAFLLNNNGAGPVASAESVERLELGDLIQLYSRSGFYHTLILTGFHRGSPLVCAHTDDAYMRPLDTYYFSKKQGLHIIGVNLW